MTKKELSEKIQGLAHIGVMVSDLEVSKQFYIDILTMEVLHENVVKADIGDVGVCFLKKGDMTLSLWPLPAPESPIVKLKKFRKCSSNPTLAWGPRPI